MKARKEAENKEVKYDEVSVILEPTLREIEEFIERASGATAMAYDIETKPNRRQILCIGFGLGDVSLVVPFVDRRKPGYNYWKSVHDEVTAWRLVRKLLQLPIPKVTQNGLYDISWLWKLMGIAPGGSCEDTMLFHHSMFPEMTKGLDFLGSIYCNLPAWKTEHKRGEFNKREE
jgi:hypothetical protein